MSQAIVLNEAENAIQRLLSGYGLAGRQALSVLRGVAERIGRTEESPASAFEQLRLRSVGAERDLLAEEGGAVADAKFAQLLGVKSRQTVQNYRDAGRILAVPRGARNFVYPVWQVKNRELLPGLEPVLRALRPRTSPLGIVLFFLTPAEALEDKRPLDLLRKGKVDEVLEHAQRYGDIGS
jgi:hypothetical protein